MRKFITACLLPVLFAACTGPSSDMNNNPEDFVNGGPDAPFYNERSQDFIQGGNQYADLDSYKPKSTAEREANEAKWNTARMEVRWQEYKGAMIRVEILLGNSDVREMRLRLIQNADGMDIDGEYREVLGKVADFEMKKVCGRNAKSIAIIYDEPAFESMRPTPYFDYRIEAEGTTMREYGFRCVYK